MRSLLYLATLTVACSDNPLGPDAAVSTDATPDATIDAALDGPTCPDLGVVWEVVPPAPLIGDGACPGWRCRSASDPALARAPDGSLTLWFSTVGIVPGGEGFVAELNIGRATAATAAGPWQVAPDAPVLHSPVAGAWDRSAETVSVLHDGDRWRLWYLGYRADGFVEPGLGQMESQGGLTWTRAAQPIYRAAAGAWDSALLSGPSALRGPDGVYRLYFAGVSSSTGRSGIGLLTSTDGVSWTPHPGNPVFTAGPAGAWDDTVLEPSVRYHDGRYWLYYTGYQGPLTDATSIAVGLATSSDGVSWQRHAANPVLRPGAPGSWSELRVLAPDLLVEPDGSFVLAAYGQANADPGNQQPGRTGLWRSRCD